MNEKVRSVLDREIKMTMGCTDPGAVAYAAAKAASILDGDLRNIDVILSKNIYKNAVYVGIPVIKKYGIEYAALLGAMIKKPEMKLAVLGEISTEMVEKLEIYIKQVPVSVVCSDIDEPLYINITCSSNISSVTVIIKGDYDWICHIEKDNQIIYHAEPEKNDEEDSCQDWNFKDLFSMAVNENIDAGFLLKYEEINRDAAIANLSADIKLYLKKLAKYTAVSICDMANMARIYVLNASKMRMSGERMPIVSVAGSGNLGIAALLTISAVCDALRVTPEEKAKALYMSVLVSIYIKRQMNRLTVICGTAVAGAAGAAAATAYLLGGDCKAAEEAVNTVIGSIAGILCDGAKEGCAFKVGFAAECAVMCGYMAINNAGIKPGSGIITHNIDNNIRNIGHINNVGMKEVDNIMLRILSTQNKE
ncbi:MAG: L-serine ammonia-lyase, iron-sulfur-dependent, subunit alpha [Ruminiclostridium sp.]